MAVSRPLLVQRQHPVKQEVRFDLGADRIDGPPCAAQFVDTFAISSGTALVDRPYPMIARGQSFRTICG